ncbi:MAG: ParB/RepB/Spo0J family partition protein [Nanoarchaeota archaeon]
MTKIISSGEIPIHDIKHIINARFRNQGDVADLIGDIKEHGLLQPVGIRASDNALIYGNRRVEAFEKSGYKLIRCDFYDDMTDIELMAMNIRENDKRKNITSVERGRGIWNMQHQNPNLSLAEIAAMLTMTVQRARILLKVYEVVAGTPYEKYVVQGRKAQGIPENFVEQCQTTLARTRVNKKLSDRDWNILLEAAKDRKLTLRELAPLKKICYAKPNIQMELAIKMLNKCRVVEVI